MIDTHKARVQFGKHTGEFVTRLPVGYLRWAVTASVDKPVQLQDGTEVPFHEVARAEIERRGDRLDGIEVSGHAVDRASQRFLSVWEKSREPDEGLYAWLQRISLEALEKAKNPRGIGSATLNYPGTKMRLVIDTNMAIPILLTVK